MKFRFEYDVGNRVEVIEVAVSDALIALAQNMGYDLVTVENLVHQEIDRFVRAVQPVNFWGDFDDTK